MSDNPALAVLREHLPSLGYVLGDPDEDGCFWANHKVRPSMLVMDGSGGFAFGAPFGIQKFDDSGVLYALLNKINSSSTLVRGYVDEEFFLFFDAWVPDATSLEGITLALDVFARDVAASMREIIRMRSN